MFIRNIITTSALVVLLGLTGGSAYAGDAGDNSILSTAMGGSEYTVEVYDANAYQAAWKAAHGGEVAETASTDFNGFTAVVGDAGDNDILVLVSISDSDANESASTDSTFVSFYAGDAGDNDILVLVDANESEIASTDLN